MRFLIIDDHGVVQEGVRRLLVDEWQEAEVVCFRTGREALNGVAQSTFNLIILDINLPDINGVEVLKSFKATCPSVPVVVLSFHPEEQYAVRALKYGATAYITKESAPNELVTAVKTALSGEPYVTQSVAKRLVEAVAHGSEDRTLHARLSDRELEVLSMFGRGMSTTNIAHALSLSVKTVSTYRTRLLTKLRLSTTAALIRYALEQGLTR